MRITSISSSIASVVTRVIDSVVFGAERMPIHLTLMRDHLGCWLERCLSLPGLAFASSYLNYQASNPQAGNKPAKPGARQLRQTDIALAVHSAPGRLTSVSTRSRG